HAVGLDRVQHERRIRGARDLDAEKHLEIEGEMQSLRDTNIYALRAVLGGAVRLRLMQLSVRYRERGAARIERRLQIAGHVNLVSCRHWRSRGRCRARACGH